MMANTRRNMMIRDLNMGMMFACLLSVPAFAQVDQKAPQGKYGTYKLKDKKGYVNPIGIPRCDASAEEILDRWRGSLVIEYTKGTVSVNNESWDTYPVPWWCSGVNAHRPPDPSIKGQIAVSFDLQGRDRRGVAYLTYSDDGTKCQTAIVFAGEWSPP